MYYVWFISNDELHVTTAVNGEHAFNIASGYFEGGANWAGCPCWIEYVAKRVIH